MPELEAQYANLVTPPPPPRDQKPIMVPPPAHQSPNAPKAGVPLPGFPGSPSASGGGPTLADQLKNRLEERRRSKEEENGGGVDAMAADVKQAVMVANEAGRKLLSGNCRECAWVSS